MPLELPPGPASLKPIQHYLKLAAEHEGRDPVITYWCRLYGLQMALELDKKSDEAKLLLVKLMDWLESEKKALADNESVTNDIAAHAHIENYALKLFTWADSNDRAGVFNKSVVKTFYTSGMLMDVLVTFGELEEDIVNKSKYAKWKAAYIHNCLKEGQTPIAGPAAVGDDDDNEILKAMGEASTSDNSFRPQPNIQPAAPSTAGIVSPQQPFTPASVPPSFPSAAPQPSPVAVPQTSFVPAVTPTSSAISASGIKLDPSQIAKAQKYCKFAGSALNYDDVTEAINCLQKALRLLQTGEDS